MLNVSFHLGREITWVERGLGDPNSKNLMGLSVVDRKVSSISAVRLVADARLPPGFRPFELSDTGLSEDKIGGQVSRLKSRIFGCRMKYPYVREAIIIGSI